MADTVNPYDLILEQTDTEAVEAVMIGSETLEMLEALGDAHRRCSKHQTGRSAHVRGSAAVPGL